VSIFSNDCDWCGGCSCQCRCSAKYAAQQAATALLEALQAPVTETVTYEIIEEEGYRIMVPLCDD
jgi:hypothetical protein